MSREGANNTASGRRRREAREQGQIAHSRELVFALMLGCVCLFAVWQGPIVLRHARSGLVGVLTTAGDPISSDTLVNGTQASIFHLALRLLPLLAVVGFAAVLGHVVQNAPSWLPQRIIPDVSRVNPAAGVARLTRRNPIVSMLLGAAKLLFVVGAGAWFLSREFQQLMGLTAVTVEQLPVVAGPLVFRFSAHLLGGYAVFALLDYAAVYFQTEAELLMTDDELRDEVKAVRNDVREFRRR